MADDLSHEDLVARSIYAADDELVPLIARSVSPIAGATKLQKYEQWRLFWEPDPTVDVEALKAGQITPEQVALLGDVDPTTTPDDLAQRLQEGQPLTDEQIGLLKFPHRGPLMTGGGRALDPAAQTRYVEEMVKLGPPTPEQMDDPFREARDRVTEAPVVPGD